MSVPARKSGDSGEVHSPLYRRYVPVYVDNIKEGKKETIYFGIIAYLQLHEY